MLKYNTLVLVYEVHVTQADSFRLFSSTDTLHVVNVANMVNVGKVW